LSQQWYQHYQALQNFIGEHPGVEVGENLVSIDERTRPDFYKAFNRVRASFLAQNYSAWLDEAEFLSTKYMKVESDLKERLRLEDVLMPLELRRSLSDPMRQMVRELFDPLFELLQEKIEPEEFEETALETVHGSFRNLYQRGYIKWFVLSLIQKLNPEKLYEVPIPQPSSKEIIKQRQDFRQTIPFPEETKYLGFEVGRRDILLVPDFIVRSALLEKYVAFRTEIGKAIWRAVYHSDKREWLSIASMVEDQGVSELKPDLLLYVGDNLEDVSLVADSEKICRPDMAVLFLDQLGADEDSLARRFDTIKLYHQVLKPVRGTCVISKHHPPEHLLQGLDENIRVIHFGFNNLKWDIALSLLRS